VNCLQLRFVRKGFGSRCIIYEATCRFEQGVHLIEGNNGSGKTTLLHLMVGLVEPTAGEVLLGERNLRRCRKIVHKKTVFVAAESAYFDGVSVRFAVQLYLSLRDGGRVTDPFERFDPFGLERFADVLFGNLSLGWKKRVLLHMALVTKPPVLVLDEPTVGLDSEAIGILGECIRQREPYGLTVLTCHNPEGLSLRNVRRYVLDQQPSGSVLRPAWI